MRLTLTSVALACVLAACGGSAKPDATPTPHVTGTATSMRATGQFTCPSPPLSAEAAAVCQGQHERVNRLTLDIQQGQVTGDAATDGAYGPPSPENGCQFGMQLAVKITGVYDASAHTITGTFSLDETTTAGTCGAAPFPPTHGEAPFHATVRGNTITGQSGVLFFEATLP